MKNMCPGTACAAGLFILPALAGINTVAYDSTREVANLSLSEISNASQIYACCAATDPGNDVSTWSSIRCLTEIAAGATSATVRLPAAWRHTGGTVRFFLADRLAYHPLQYVYSAGNAWIDTGVVPDTTTSISMRFRIGTSNHMPLFGVETYFYCFDNGNYTYYGFFGAEGSFARHTADLAEHTLSFGQDGASIDGESKTDALTATSTMTASRTLTLFGRRNYTSDTPQGYCNNNTYICWANIDQNGTRIRTLKPCLKDGQAAFYDAVTGAFYFGFGTGTLTPGPTDFSQLTVRSISDAVSVVPVTRRIVSSTYDPDTACAIVTLSNGAQTKSLYMAYDTADRGTNILNWATVRAAATVPGGTTRISVPVPATWRSTSSRLRFFTGSRDLPSGRRVHALYATGTQYIDSGIVPDVHTMTRVTYRLCNSGKSAYYNPPFGISTHYYCFDNSGKTYWGFFGTEGNFAQHANDHAIHTLEFGPGGAFVDNLLKADIAADTSPVTLTQTIPFFGRRAYGSTSITLNAAMRIFSARVERDGAVLGDFVPVLDADGHGAFYNSVDGTLHTNAGTGDFECDEDLTAGTDYDAELMESVSPFVPLGGPDLTTTLKARTLTVRVGAASEDGALFLARSAADAGGAPSAWETVTYLASVPAAGGTFSYTIPAGSAWRKAGTVLRVFLSPASRPYTKIGEYLHGNGTGWIDTGIVPDKTTRLTARYRTSHKMPFFGIAGYFSCFQCTAKIVYFDYFSGDVSVSLAENTGIHMMSFGYDGYTLDGTLLETVPSTPHTLPSEQTFPLFGRYDFDAKTVNKLNKDCDLYWADIEKGGTRVRSFVVCETEDGAAGLYDRVNGTVHTNANVSGTFTMGGTTSTAPLLDDFETLSASAPMTVMPIGMTLVIR